MTSSQSGNGITRRAFLFRSGGVAGGALAGKGLFEAVAWYTGNALRNMERAVAELTLDLEMLSGSLEAGIEHARDELQKEFEEHKGAIRLMGLSPVVKEDGVEELLENLAYVGKRYTFAQRFHQFRIRLHRRLLHIDSSLENLKPDVMKRVDDVFRGLHGMPTGEDYQRQHEELTRNLELLGKAFGTAEDTRRIELVLSKEITNQLRAMNTVANDPALQTLLEEFKQMVEDHLDNPVESPAKDDEILNKEELEKFPELTARELQQLQMLVEQFTEAVEKTRLLLQHSADTQQLLGEAEQLTVALSGQNYASMQAETRQQRAKELEELRSNVDEKMVVIRSLGFKIKSRREIIEEDVVTKSLGDWFTGNLAGPVQWALIAICGLLGFIAGGKIGRARKKAKKDRSQ